jgi:CRISPR-associated protein Cas1
MPTTQLILNRRGASLSVKNGRFWVRTDERETFIPAHQVRSICLHPATKITYEAMILALEHDTDVLLVDRKGFPVGRVWGNRFGSISTIRKNQLAFSTSKDALEWVKQVLIRKADNQLAVLQLLTALLQTHSNANLDSQTSPAKQAHYDNQKLTDATKTIERLKDKFKYHQSSDLQDSFASFRGFEGSMSRAYFEALSGVLPEKYRFKKRTQHPAMDAFNCLLNYAYGMLYGQCEGALIRAGLDPAIGIMHRDEYNRPVLVYDFIELFRAWADYVVCHLCVQEVVYDEFFEVQNGQYWLNTTGKRILIQSVNDYLEELILFNNLSRSRLTHIELEAQKIAAQMKRFVASTPIPGPFPSEGKGG